MKKHFLIVVSILIITACGSESGNNIKKNLPESIGSPYELVIVCDNDLWETSAGDTVKNTFQESEVMLNQPESMFSIIRKRESGFKGLFTKHRNVLMLTIDTALSKTDKMMYGITYDNWAMPQVIVSLKTKDSESMKVLFEMKRDEIVNAFEDAEQSRFESKLIRYGSSDIDTLLKNNFGLYVSLPKNYKVRDIQKPDFIWLSYEMPVSSQGVVIYTYPYNGEELNSEFLISKRNEFLKRIPGQLPNTYMQTSDAFAPIEKDVVIKGREWVKLSGFWNLENDFMGGPFRNFTTIDVKNNRVVSIDCYVYSPDANKGQRNYIKQLEAVVRTFKLD